MRSAARDAIVRQRDPRVVFRARVIRMSVARLDGDGDTVLADANALLDTDPIPVVPERNMYEELKNSIQQAADGLVEMGQTEDAIAILERLSARFPQTLLATQVEARVNNLRRDLQRAVQ